MVCPLLFVINQNNAWSGNIEIAYTYDPFAGLVDSIIELTNSPEVVFASGESGGGLVASSDDTGYGALTASFRSINESEVNFDDYVFDGLGFSLSGKEFQLWDISYDGELTGEEMVELVFDFDPTGLTDLQIDPLAIYHFEDDTWNSLNGVVDKEKNTITVSTSRFSPFALGSAAVPEPSTLALFAFGLIGVGFRRLKKQ